MGATWLRCMFRPKRIPVVIWGAFRLSSAFSCLTKTVRLGPNSRKTGDRLDGLFTPNSAIVKSSGAVALLVHRFAPDGQTTLPESRAAEEQRRRNCFSLRRGAHRLAALTTPVPGGSQSTLPWLPPRCLPSIPSASLQEIRTYVAVPVFFVVPPRMPCLASASRCKARQLCLLPSSEPSGFVRPTPLIYGRMGRAEEVRVDTA